MSQMLFLLQNLFSYVVEWIFFAVTLITEAAQSIPQQNCKPGSASQIDRIEIKSITPDAIPLQVFQKGPSEMKLE